MKRPAGKRRRCAFLHPGLDQPRLEQDFNSLDNQREAAEADIRAKLTRAGA